MHHYPHHIGDYRRDAMHLSLLKHGVYRQLLDTYYLHEKPLPPEIDLVCEKVMARTEEEVAAVAAVLKEFFKLRADGWHHTRCDEEIATYQCIVDAARANGKKGGRPRNSTLQNVLIQKNSVGEEGGFRNSENFPNEHLPGEPLPEPLKTGVVISGLSVGNPEVTQTKANQEPRTKNQDKEGQKHIGPPVLVLVPPVPRTVPDCPHQKIIALYHEVLPMLPRIEEWGSARSKTLTALWRNKAVEFEWESEADGLAMFRSYFAYVAKSPFLTGRTAPVPPRTKPFVANLEWLIKPANFIKVREKKFHDKQG